MHERACAGEALLIDIRESGELSAGVPSGARHVPCAELERRIRELIPRHDFPVYLICARGRRSLIAAGRLRELGYTRARSVRGGVSGWREGGLPVDSPGPGQADDFGDRYLRHLAMPEVGPSGQRRLKAGRVLVIGAGGLGSPAALYLAAAGVGRIGVVDDDCVERSNLQRQILHADHRVGQAKTRSAATRLLELNPEIRVDTHDVRLDVDNAESVLDEYEVIVDGSDNFPTRYLLNDVCIRQGKPLVYGAVLRFEGHVAVFRAGDGISPCYRCLFPEAPDPADSPSCVEAGVLGVLPGVIGCLQAAETLKLLLDIGQPLIGRLLRFDALAGRFSEARIERDPACRWCAR